MNIIKNPAKSRPLSANVRRLMTKAREAPANPNVKKIERAFSARDLAYCDMQGNIFMAALDRGVAIGEFTPVYMNSQLAGVMDYSFSCVGGYEFDDLSKLLQVPLLLKSPETIVDVTVWLNNIVNALQPNESANVAVVQACLAEKPPVAEVSPAAEASSAAEASPLSVTASTNAAPDIDALADEYEYAYWLGYIYRYECLLHDESGAFSEPFMKQTYAQMLEGGINEESLCECAGEICKRLDMLLIVKLWKETRVKENG